MCVSSSIQQVLNLYLTTFYHAKGNTCVVRVLTVPLISEGVHDPKVAEWGPEGRYLPSCLMFGHTESKSNLQALASLGPTPS
jgi:hypothetical protein